MVPENRTPNTESRGGPGHETESSPITETQRLYLEAKPKKEESYRVALPTLYRKVQVILFLFSNFIIVDIATAIKRSNVPWQFIVEECPHRASVATVT